VLGLSELRAGQPFRVHVCGGGVRALVLADVIRRQATVAHDLRVFVTSAFTESISDQLNVHPVEVVDDVVDASVFVGCVRDSRPSVEVGSLSLGSGAETTDPLALRLVLLEAEHAHPVEVDADAVTSADETITRWRGALATWARSPGAPMSQTYVRRIVAALDDLATSPALQALHELEADPSVAAGAKFETFAYADRLLGLDLARNIGH
jgi:hypothetical protein